MFKVLENGIAPTRATKYSAAVDLYASEDVTIGAGETKMIGLGVCIDENAICNIVSGSDVGSELTDLLISDFKESHYLQLMLRSSLGKKGLILPNGVGIIDLDCKDEIKLIIHYPYSREFEISGGKIDTGYFIKKGDKIAQILLKEHKSYLFGIDTEVERNGGFGSSGDR